MRTHRKWAALCASLAFVGLNPVFAQESETATQPEVKVPEVQANENRIEENDGNVLGIETQNEDRSILGLPTSNEDGTILGLFPAPSRTVEAGSEESYIAEELADGEVDPGVENVFQADQTAVGAPPTSEREQAASKFVGEKELPAAVQNALRQQGWNAKDAEVSKVVVYEIEMNGKTVYATPDGELLKPSLTEQE